MARFGVKEVADVMLINLLTNKVDLFLDTLKLSNLENAAETVYANGGKGAPRLVSWDFGRTATFNIQDALLNPKSIAMQAGTELEKKVETIYERVVLMTTDDGSGNSKFTLEHTPDAGSVEIYETTDGYGQDKEVDKQTITVTGSDVTVPSASLAVGTQVIVYFTYQSTSDSEVITLKSDKFGGFYKVVGKTFWRSEATGKDEKVQIVIPKAKISSAFTLTMQPDGDPSVFDLNLDVFKDPSSTDMVKIVRY
ncbi:hypothetical protein M5X00_29570 [Paenibacillus alvei]|uniref:hypothetical protein n=2 Tax=Paenibacillus alvei TaxID=44250 RepID=UPI0002883B6A|nr:hypothetical protein [Paenibacillus alvei]EJW14020.1 putative phage structural protein [Paenibacillus alvei DSM 29]MCY9707627.1 hypothetical protein [Paenibacillus alvei]MCY9758370.1 hypothetical protein [Paenibacillus alvei]MEC0082861.1 hypothetical protein [Paenibacillus alvei]